jgi:predicted RNA binding protein YcfA (HicA-like mRNA interferase family)
MQIIRALRKLGFEEIRVKGSHDFLRPPDGRCTVVPAHRGEPIGRGLLAQILRDCDVSREELQDKL